MKNSLVLSMIFLAAAIAAPTLAVSVVPVDFFLDATEPATIYAGNMTNFSIIITNSGADDWFSIAAIGSYPSWVTIDKQSVFIPSGSSASSTIWVSPVSDAYPNKYEYSIIVSSAGGNAAVAEKKVFVNVLQSSSLIISESSLSCKVCNPAETVVVSATLKNIGTRPLNNMKLVFTMGERSKVMPVSTLDYGSVKSFSSDFSLDPLLAPGEYKIEAKAMQDTSVLAQKDMPFSVPSVSNILMARNVSSSIFGNYVTLALLNQGNAPKSEEVKSEVLGSWYSLYSGPKPSSVGPIYGWLVSLAPNESMTITYSEVFWPVPLLLIVLVFAASYYYISATSLSIRKRIIQGHPVSEGREVSVSLDVKSGLRPIDNVVVRDAVPKNFELSGKFETLKPVIRKVSSGTELVWRLGRMKSNEERVLHYRIKALSPFESIRLHPAELNGRRGDNAVSRASNFSMLKGAVEPIKSIKVVVGE